MNQSSWTKIIEESISLTTPILPKSAYREINKAKETNLSFEDLVRRTVKEEIHNYFKSKESRFREDES